MTLYISRQTDDIGKHVDFHTSETQIRELSDDIHRDQNVIRKGRAKGRDNILIFHYDVTHLIYDE